MSTIQIISSHHQLQTQLRRNLHVRYTFNVLVSLMVVEVLHDLLEYDAAQILQVTYARLCFAEVAYMGVSNAVYMKRPVKFLL
jgi:hypothetical protein